jgi:hypothetical protein
MTLSRGCVIVLTTVLMAACTHGGRSSAVAPRPDTTCSAPASAPRNNATQNVIVASADHPALVRSVEERLALMGARCPEATVALAVSDLPLPPGAETLDMRWLRGVGDDPAQANAEAAYFLEAGDLTLFTITDEPPGECLGDPGLRDRSPADVLIAGRCTHLRSTFIDHLRPTKAAVTPTADPLAWTLTLTFDRATARRVAKATKPLFASIDGFPMGRASLVGRVLTSTGAYMGGGTEARAHAVNVQVPILVAIQGWGVSS